MKIRSTLSWLMLLMISAFLLVSCGGGGGGGDDFAAANVTINATPSSIDTGDRAEVRIAISDITESGIILKVRFPSELSYVPSSSFLILENSNAADIAPTFTDSSTEQGFSFVVYVLEFGVLGPNNRGEVILQLRGDESTEGNDNDNSVEVDADFLGDDPVTLERATSEFSAEDEAAIQVESES